MDKKLYIFCAGNATVGKDSFYELLQKSLSNYTVARFALADSLKRKMSNFVEDTFNIDIFNCTREEKELIRPLMVEVGKIKRKQSNGQYWWKLLDEKMEKTNFDIGVVTDCRYAEGNGTDELDWALSKKPNSVLVFIKRYDKFMNDGRAYVVAPNIDEKVNNERIEKKSDYILDWHSVGRDRLNELQSYIDSFITFLKDKNYL